MLVGELSTVAHISDPLTLRVSPPPSLHSPHTTTTITPSHPIPNAGIVFLRVKSDKISLAAAPQDAGGIPVDPFGTLSLFFFCRRPPVSWDEFARGQVLYSLEPWAHGN